MRGTRNAVRGNSSWVRIPPPPPKAEAYAQSASLMEAEGLRMVLINGVLCQLC